jgi:hypothetical protein
MRFFDLPFGLLIGEVNCSRKEESHRGINVYTIPVTLETRRVDDFQLIT